MFNKDKFSNILIEINKKYNNMTEFAEIANFDRSYISKYIHKKLDNPPTPKILMGIANASKGTFNYYELMEICGYMKDLGISKVTNSLKNPSDITSLYIFENIKNELTYVGDLWVNRNFIVPGKSYFAYRTNNDEMLPLLGTGDIAIIQKTDKYENGNTCLISLDSNLILIRKILDFNNYIELQTAFPFNPPIKISKDEISKRKFKVLGKVIRVENESAFK